MLACFQKNLLRLASVSNSVCLTWDSDHKGAHYVRNYRKISNFWYTCHFWDLFSTLKVADFSYRCRGAPLSYVCCPLQYFKNQPIEFGLNAIMVCSNQLLNHKNGHLKSELLFQSFWVSRNILIHTHRWIHRHISWNSDLRIWKEMCNSLKIS